MVVFKVINSEFEINGKTIPLIQSPKGEIYGVNNNDVVEIGGTIDAPVLTDIKIGKITRISGVRSRITSVTVELI